MGKKAARLLIEQIEKAEELDSQLLTVSGELLEGHSVKNINS